MIWSPEITCGWSMVCHQVHCTWALSTNKKNECHQITEKLFVWCKKRKTIIIWSPVNSDWVADSQC